MNTFKFLLIVKLMFLISFFACEFRQGPTELTKVQSEINIHVSSLLKPQNMHGSLVSRATILDSIILSVRTNFVDDPDAQPNMNETRQDFAKKITPADSIVTFNVKTELGQNTFIVTIKSNKGVTIYFGRQDLNIENSDFTVEIELIPVSPILEVIPDVIAPRPDKSDTLIIYNRGTGTLEWTKGKTTIPENSCKGECLSFYYPSSDDVNVNISAGNISAGKYQTIIVTSSSNAIGEYELFIESKVGAAAVKVH